MYCSLATYLYVLFRRILSLSHRLRRIFEVIIYVLIYYVTAAIVARNELYKVMTVVGELLVGEETCHEII